MSRSLSSIRATVASAAALGTITLFAQAPAPGAASSPARAGQMVEFSHETRFQMDYRVPEAALAAMMPAGFTSNVATDGPAKDCNLRVIFIDRVTINGPDGRPVGRGSSHLVYLEAPARDPSGASVRVAIGGLTDDPADAPGPFGNYLPATRHAVRRTTTAPESGNGPTVDSQDWVFAAATGEHIEMHVTYQRGVGNRGMRPEELRIHSASNPALVHISTQDRVLDILRNTTTRPADRVKAYSFKAGGGSYARLFDGTEEPLSWDNILATRTVSLP